MVWSTNCQQWSKESDIIRDFLLFFNENIVIEYSEDLYNDFIMQLGGKRFGHGLFNSFSKDNVKKLSVKHIQNSRICLKFLVMIGLDVVLELI